MEIEFKPRDLRRKSDTPKLKKCKKSDENEMEESSMVANKTGQTPKKQIRATVLEVKLNQYKSFTVKKTGRHVSIDLNYIDEKCYFTIHVSFHYYFLYYVIIFDCGFKWSQFKRLCYKL